MGGRGGGGAGRGPATANSKAISSPQGSILSEVDQMFSFTTVIGAIYHNATDIGRTGQRLKGEKNALERICQTREIENMNRINREEKCII